MDAADVLHRPAGAHLRASPGSLKESIDGPRSCDRGDRPRPCCYDHPAAAVRALQWRNPCDCRFEPAAHQGSSRCTREGRLSTIASGNRPTRRAVTDARRPTCRETPVPVAIRAADEQLDQSRLGSCSADEGPRPRRRLGRSGLPDQRAMRCPRNRSELSRPPHSCTSVSGMPLRTSGSAPSWQHKAWRDWVRPRWPRSASRASRALFPSHRALDVAQLPRSSFSSRPRQLARATRTSSRTAFERSISPSTVGTRRPQDVRPDGVR